MSYFYNYENQTSYNLSLNMLIQVKNVNVRLYIHIIYLLKHKSWTRGSFIKMVSINKNYTEQNWSREKF